MTVFAWIFFRLENIKHSISYISEIFSVSLYTIPELRPRSLILLTMVFVFIEWLVRDRQYAISNLDLKWKRPLRYALYYVINVAIIWFSGKEKQFIYIQF